MNKIDRYIIKKFIGTFFYALTLLLLVVIVIDISEKIDDFMEHDLDMWTIISEYYLHFIPYFANLFSPLFIFISVVFFTSKLADNSEIIAIFNSGMSFKRFLRPFIISSVFLASLSFLLGSFVIPIANKNRIDFENKYLVSQKKILRKNIHLQTSENQYIYLEGYNNKRNIGYKFSLENFENGILKSKIRANYIQWNETSENWTINNYEIRTFYKEKESIISGVKLDSTLLLLPSDFIVQLNLAETMNLQELNENIITESSLSSGKAKFYKIEKHKRIAFPFAIIILTVIAVALSSRKVKGAIGTNMGLGLLISFSYILFFQFSSTFATNGNLEPWLAVWIPNILYILLGIFLLRRTQNS
jgi:lipopolysaccharide export system permease protein